MTLPKRKKIKPLWDEELWDFNAPVDEMLDDEALSIIAAQLKAPELASKTSFYQDLCMMGSQYSRLKADLPEPSRLQVKAALNHVASASKELQWCLKHIDYSSKMWLRNNWVPLIAERDERLKRLESIDFFDRDVADWNLEDDLCVEFINELGELLKAAEAASESIDDRDLPKPKRGRKRNEALHAVILNLHELYNEHVGNDVTLTYDPVDETYKGPFFELVRTCLSYIDPDFTGSNIAIGDAIRRATGKKK